MGRRGRRRGTAKASSRRTSTPGSPRPGPQASSPDPLTHPIDMPIGRDEGADLGAQEVGAPLATLLDEQWWDSRSGAIAGRGYHFQDVIGTWLATRTIAGGFVVEQIVPEGLEDLSCEGMDAWHVQVKSRQAHVGDFPAAKAAGFVIDAWLRHRQRSTEQHEARLAVVFERPIARTSLGSWGQSLEEALSPDDAFRGALARAAAARDLDENDFAQVLQGICVVVVTWDDAEAETSTLLAQDTGLPAAAVLPIMLALRAEVARCADANAATSWSTRAGLTRTSLRRRVDELAALVDREALLEAVRDGVCEAVDLATPLEDASFYEGVAVQPGHVPAGLTVPRPDVVDAVLAGLDRTGACLVAGPSGAGKSAVAWMTAYVSRHVLWYRVRRLREQDVHLLLRLADAAGASVATPVGFVVDGVGVGALEAWDVLRRETAGRAGVLLLGSVRTEDMFPLATLADCAVVQPRLDEALAARIHSELTQRAATSTTHWLEAYERSDGLTLEYTYLLTRGRRLRDVLAEQVRARVRERRDIELAALATVASAHRWGASVPVAGLADALGVSEADLSRALRRLIDEHVLRREGDRLAGLHPLRSTVLAEEAHATPPPTMADTTRRLLWLLPPGELRTFVAGLLTDRHDLDGLVVTELAERAAGDEFDVLIAALHALRLADFSRTARRWVQVLDRHGVPPSMRPVTLNWAFIDSSLPEALSEAIDQRIIAAISEIGSTERDTCPMRDALVAAVGTEAILSSLARCSEPLTAARLLAPLAHTQLNSDAQAMVAGVPLATALRTASVNEIATLLAAAREVSLSLAEHLVGLTGGQDEILKTVFADHPWLTELEVIEQDGQTVSRARVLPAAGAPETEIDEDVRELARLLLHFVPAADKADVAAVFPGGRPMRIGDYTHATSGLLRQYARGRTAIAWNRARLRIAMAMVADADTTRRLNTGRRLLGDATPFVHTLSTGWIRGRLTRDDRDRLTRILQRLIHDVEQMHPPPPGTALYIADVDEEGMLEIDDPLHTLLHGIVSNLPGRLIDAEPNYRSLAAFIGDTLTREARKVEALDWRLLGLTQAPDTLPTLHGLLRDLHAVLAELAWGNTPQEALAREAKSTSRRTSLHQAATLARLSANRRLHAMVADLRQQCIHQQLDAEVVIREESYEREKATVWPPHTLAILVRLDSLSEWQDAQIRLREILTNLPETEPPVTLVPVRTGRIVPSFAATYVRQLWPAPNATRDWGDRLPPPHTTPLATSTLQAHQALQTLSAIAELARIRDIRAPVEAAAHTAASDFQHARHTIAAMTRDAVVEEVLDTLDTIAGRVQDELDGNLNDDDHSLAANIIEGIEEPNEDFNILAGLSLVTHEWDIDPAGARRLLSV